MARCSSCHNFCRSCPPGQPNHQGIAPVGPNCPMNSQGRHYRNPDDPENPTCNYQASSGDRCTFFEDSHFASLPYPEDVTFGPVSEPETPNPELASILALLNEQKAASERQQRIQQEQADQMRALQVQFNNMMQGQMLTSTTTTISPAVSSTLITTVTPTLSSVTSAPQAPGPSTLNPQGISTARNSILP